MVRYREHAPPRALSPWVVCLWTAEAPAGAGAFRPVHPDGCIDLLFDAAASRLEVVGTMTRTLWIEDRGRASYTGVRFRPGGAAVLLRERASSLTDRAIDAGDLLGPSARALHEQLASDPARALEVITAFLTDRLDQLEPVDRRIEHAASLLWTRPATRVEDLTEGLGVSRQYLRRLFLDHVGVAPKMFARAARARAAVASIDRGASLTRAALAAGYADHAHMTRELVAIVGVTPRAYRERARG